MREVGTCRSPFLICVKRRYRVDRRLQIKVEGGAVIARLETESQVARAILTENLPILRERLAEQGIRIEQFDIDLMDRQPEGSPEQANDDPTHDKSSPQEHSSNGDESDSEPVTETSPPSQISDDDQLDIVV